MFKGKPNLCWALCRRGIGGMSGFGGYKSRFLPRKSRIQFFTYGCKLGEILETSDQTIDFQTFTKKFAHKDIVEIFLELHMVFNPIIADLFLRENMLYLEGKQHTKNVFDKEFHR